MKTKLLKKVRKRYEIIRIDELSNRANRSFIEFKNKYGLPFFQIIDNEYEYEFYEFYLCYTYKEALNKLIELIHTRYVDKMRFKTKRNKTSKVWYK